MRIYTLKEYEDFAKDQLDQTSLSMGGIQLLFRGHALDSYKLLPSISRNQDSIEKILKFEANLSIELKSRIHNSYIGGVRLNLPSQQDDYLYDWYLQFQARHLEIPSRLLDWTTNYKMALYFALMNKNHRGKDGHVWIYPSFKDLSIIKNQASLVERFENEYLHLSAGDSDKEKLKHINPFAPEKITLVHNSFVTDDWENQVGERRRFAQNGKFIAKPNNLLLMPLENHLIRRLMQKVIIDGNSKENIYNELMDKYDAFEEKFLPVIPQDTKDLVREIILAASNN